MQIHNSPQRTQETILRWKHEKVALVPTMGCLHEGHLALVRHAKKYGSKVVVSIFVNPLQFGPGEDFEKYPRTFSSDCEKLEALGVDLVFNPQVKDLYPEGFATTVKVGELGDRLCGAYRKGHFDGVATVCLKLFQVSMADFAVFGEKDFQQLRVIQQMTSDFNLPITILPLPTVRDTDSLALSSRNTYLTPAEREAALVIPHTLSKIREFVISNGGSRVKDVLKIADEGLHHPLVRVQYAEVTQTRALKTAEPDSLIHGLSNPHFFVAALVGTTRLIDNISLNGDHT